MFSWGQHTLSMDTFQNCQFTKHIYLKFKFSASSNFSFGRKLNILAPASLQHDWTLMTSLTLLLTENSLFHSGAFHDQTFFSASLKPYLLFGYVVQGTKYNLGPFYLKDCSGIRCMVLTRQHCKNTDSQECSKPMTQNHHLRIVQVYDIFFAKIFNLLLILCRVFFILRYYNFYPCKFCLHLPAPQSPPPTIFLVST